MLNASTEYTGQSSTKNIVSDWLLELSYDDTTPGTFYFSGQDRIVTNLYHGNVIDWGNIDESIDLPNSKASVADIEIVLANSWANASGLLSAELFGGSKKFINQDVTIKSWIAGLALTDCLTIYKGRLVDIKHNLETVTLTIEKRSPWDRVILPGMNTTTQSIHPASFGDFAGTNTSTTSEDFPVLKSLAPCKYLEAIGGYLRYTKQASGGTNSGYYYEESLDAFIKLDNAIAASSTMLAYKDLQRGFKWRTMETSSTNLFTNPQNALDGNTGTAATDTINASDSGDPGGSSANETVDGLHFDFPIIDGLYSQLDLYVDYSITINTLTGDSGYVRIYDHSLGTDTLIAQRTTAGTSSGTNTISIADYVGDPPEKIKLKATAFVTTSGAGAIEVDADIQIKELYLIVNTALDFTNDPVNAQKDAVSTKLLYTDADGQSQAFTGGSGVASYPHDIYRQALKNYTGWDAADIDDVAVNGGVWTDAIDTDRNWPCRWWTLEQVKLLDVLKQIEFEGGFMWVFDDTKATTGSIGARVLYVQYNDATSGSLTVGKKYIITDFQAGDDFTNVGASSNATGVEFVATGTTPTTWTNGSTLRGTYSSSDFTVDYNEITNLNISTTPFSEIVTKRTFNYQRHPADEKRYLQTNSLTNSNRGNYNLETEENAIEQNLDFLTASADVDDLLTYYDNIVGEPKIIVRCDLLNPKDWAMQVGDIVTFENMAYDPYGKSFATPIYFMCTRTNISPNKFTATFREVG